YQFLGKKSGGGWTRASGDTVSTPSPIGVTLNDAGTVPGFNGSITVTESLGAGEALVGNGPHVRIALKVSPSFVRVHYTAYPYTGAFTLDNPITNSVGLNGGFPIIFWDTSHSCVAVAYIEDNHDGAIVSR